jgi:DNA-binding NarL/FixJ family response regulator
MINVAIAVEYGIFQLGLINCLSHLQELKIVFEASNKKEFLSKLLSSNFSVCLIDVNIFMGNELEISSRVHNINNNAVLIILSSYFDDHLMKNMFNMNVRGFINKDTQPEEIYHAIKYCLEDGYYISNSFKQVVVQNLLKDIVKTQKSYDGAKKLNEKEIAVLRLICEQFTTKEISQVLHLSLRTIEGLKTGLFIKTGTKNVAGLVIFAFRNQLVSQI